MKRYVVLAITILSLCLLGGCANIEFKSVGVIKDGEDMQGFVYYDDSPYLIVYPDGKGSVTWQLQYLPDQTKKRVAVPTNFASSLNTSLSFQNGVLTQSSVTADETTILKAIGTAIQTIGPAALSAASAATQTARIHLYKIIVKDSSVVFTPAYLSGDTKTDGVEVVVPLN